jgi:spermidine synthase
MVPRNDRSPERGPGALRPAGGRATTYTMALTAIALVSGWSALVYEVMWHRSLGLVLGATAHASAVVLVAFFVGIALGSYAFGRRADCSASPLRLYAALELGIAACGAAFALAWPHLPHIVGRLALAAAGGWGLAGKAIVGTALLLPATFLMGGTIPALVRAAAADEAQFRSLSGFLYGVNTLGGCLGAGIGGLLLPTSLGITNAQWLAVAGNIAVGLGALALGRASRPEPEAVAPAPDEAESVAGSPALGATTVLLIAAVSGFCILALEVLWTRMFAQVLHNSVYSFTLILIVFLAALAFGAAATNRVAQRLASPAYLLPLLLGVAGMLVLVGNVVFVYWTGMEYFAGDAGWASYVLRVAGLAVATMVPAAFIGGMVLPLLWHLFRCGETAYGSRIGVPNLVNTLASAAGATAAGFILLPTLGLWRSIVLVAVVYFLASSIVARRLAPQAPDRERQLTRTSAWVRYATVALAALWIDPAHNPFYLGGEDGVVLFQKEGASGITAVVEDGDERSLLMDRSYVLGGTHALRYELQQGHLPLLLHPRPERVCFIGVATGVTMSAALLHPCREIIGLEIVPEVVEAMRYFDGWNSRVRDDRRVQTVVEDGRVYMAATPLNFDVVVGDLFIPWHPGAGYLYTREHFAAVKDHLRPGGLFCQWLPLYQLSETEAGIIIRTFSDVFPDMALFRCDFSATRTVIGLVGWRNREPLQLEPVARRVAHLRREGVANPFLADASAFFLTYMGDASTAERFASGAQRLNTDDRPWIEFVAPMSQRDRNRFLRMPLQRALMRAEPQAGGVFEPRLGREVESIALAGRDIHIASTALHAGDAERAARHLQAALDAGVAGPVRQIVLSLVEDSMKSHVGFEHHPDLRRIIDPLRRERALEQLRDQTTATREMIKELEAEVSSLAGD